MIKGSLEVVDGNGRPPVEKDDLRDVVEQIADLTSDVYLTPEGDYRGHYEALNECYKLARDAVKE